MYTVQVCCQPECSQWQLKIQMIWNGSAAYIASEISEVAQSIKMASRCFVHCSV